MNTQYEAEPASSHNWYSATSAGRRCLELRRGVLAGRASSPWSAPSRHEHAASRNGRASTPWAAPRRHDENTVSRTANVVALSYTRRPGWPGVVTLSCAAVARERGVQDGQRRRLEMRQCGTSTLRLGRPSSSPWAAPRRQSTRRPGRPTSLRWAAPRRHEHSTSRTAYVVASSYVSLLGYLSMLAICYAK
jgi:hypothetical protein